MQRRIREILTPPIFPGDEDKTHNAQILNTVLLGIIPMLVLAILATLLIFEQKALNGLIILFSFMAFLGARWIMHRGHVRFASAVVVIFGMSYFLIFSIFGGGPGGVAGVFGLGFTIIAGLLLGLRAAFTSSTFCCIVGLIIVIRESLGYSLPRLFPMPTTAGWFVLSIALFLAIITLDLTLRNLKGVLSQSRYQLKERIKVEEDINERNRLLLALNEISQVALFSQDLEVTSQVMAERLRDLIHADQCTITTWDSDLHKVIPTATSGDERAANLQNHPEAGKYSLTEAVLQTGNHLIAEDFHNSPHIDLEIAGHSSIISLLGVPLKTVHEDYGAILFGFYKEHHFTEDEIARCEQAASLVSLVTARLRLQEETRRRTEELEAMARVSSTMRAVKTRAEIPPVVLNQLLTLFKADGAALLFQDPQTGDFTVEAGSGTWSSFTGTTVSMGNVREFATSKFNQIFLENNVPQFLTEVGLEHSPGVQAIAGAPLIVDNTLIGGLYIGSQADINQTQLRLLVAIGDIVANALHRSAFHENLEAQFKMLKDTQARLVQSEKLAAIGELVAGVAHELNNPLTSVVLYAQMLLSQSKNVEFNHDLDTIVNEAQRASKIVRGLLGFARQHPVERKPVQINSILQSTMELVSYELRTHNIQAVTQYAPDLPFTMADLHQLQQVFINLLTNSRQAMEGVKPHGLINIISQVSPSIFSIPQSGVSPVIRITFQDNGPGIPPENLSHVFDPFFTTKEFGQGTGLGLSVCHGIISEHGGHIWVESEPGQGATFFIELPIIPPEAPVEIPGMPLFVASQDPPTEMTHVLVIDDEPNVLTIIKRTLQRRGYKVDTVHSGASAKNLLEQVSYDLILCDIHMPGMNGPDFHQFLEFRYPEMTQRIIFTSGDLSSSSTRQFLDRTGIKCLEKPFKQDELLSLVKAALEGIA
jgi:signal transduction histidine kinase/CheY-like chemotaxis protein